MKILENMRCSISRSNACRNNLARTNLLNTLHNYNFAGFEPLRDDNVAPLFDACRDTSLLDIFCVVDHQDVVACLVQQYGRLRHEKRFDRSTAVHDDANDAAWDEQPIAVR